MAVVRQLMIRAGADFSAMRKSMQKAQADLQSFKTSVTRTMAAVNTALATIGAAVGINAAMNDAIKFEALMGTLGGTLGSSMKDFMDWQQTVGDTMGFSKLQVAQMANDYSLSLKSIAKDEQDLFGKTTALIKAAAIIRSKNGMDMVEISDRMRSAMNGEADGAMELGIDVRASAIMQSNAYKQLANNAPWSELSTQMQRTILYQHILDSTTRNFGGTVANNTALLKGGFVAALGDARLALGQAFLPILNIALPLLTKLARAAETVFLKIAALVRFLFPKSNIAAGNAQTAVIDNQAAAVGGVGDAYKDQAAAADKAGKAAKKAAGSVAGFDEVNILQDPQANADTPDAGAGDVGGMSMPGMDMGAYDASLEAATAKVQEMAAKIKGIFKGINFQPLVESFNRLKAAVAPLTKTIFEGLKWAWDNILVPLGKWTIEDLVPAFLDAIAGALTVLNPLLKSFQPFATWLWDNFLKPLATFTGGVIVTTLEGVGKALTTIGNWMSEHQKTVDAVTTTVIAFFGAWKVIELMAFIQTSGSLASAFGKITQAIWLATGAKAKDMIVTAALKVMYAKDLVVSIAAATVELVKNAAKWTASTIAMGVNKAAMIAGTIAQWAMTAATGAYNIVAGIGAAVTTAFGIAMAILTSPITLVILVIAALVVGIVLLIKHWDDVKAAAAKAWELIKAAWAVAASWLDTNVIQPIAAYFKTLWTGIQTAAGTAWTTVKTAWTKAFTWFDETVLSPIEKAFSTAWNAISGAVSGVWTDLKAVWGAASTWFKSHVVAPIANLFIGLFNGIIDGVNTVIRALNKIQVKLPDWMPGGGKSFGIDIPEAPRLPRMPELERGGVVDGRTNMGNYVAGEAGPEMIVPLENTSFTDKVASALGTAVMTAMTLSQGNGKGDTIINIDGREVARALQSHNANESKRLGGSVIQVF